MPKIIKTKRLSNKSYSVPTLYAFSVIKGLVVFGIGVLACSALALKSQQSNFSYYFLYVFIALGAFVCAFEASRHITGRGFVKGLISSAIYLCAILLLTVVLMRFNVSMRLLLTVPLCLGAGFIGGTSAVK